MLNARLLLMAGASGLLFACSPAVGPDKPAGNNGAAHAQAIGKINDQWLALIRSHDAAAVSRLYAADGALMAPDAPIAQGQPAIEKAWSGLMAMPGFALTFATDQMVVAAGGDMALDRGSYQLSLDGPKGATKDVGKYVVVWRNIDGQWKVATDIFNSDGSLPQ